MLAGCVPSAVPSLKNSTFAAPSAVSARNTKLSSQRASFFGLEPVSPGIMSFTRRVPCGVPSVSQSSAPYQLHSHGFWPCSAQSVLRPSILLALLSALKNTLPSYCT